jgi:hypothetical protein
MPLPDVFRRGEKSFIKPSYYRQHCNSTLAENRPIRPITGEITARPVYVNPYAISRSRFSQKSYALVLRSEGYLEEHYVHSRHRTQD